MTNINPLKFSSYTFALDPNKYPTDTTSDDITVYQPSNNAEVTSSKNFKDLNSSSLLIRRILWPLAIALKIFGLNFGAYCPLVKRVNRIERFGMVYSICVVILLTFNAIRYIWAFADIKELSIYVRFEYFLWYVKCAVQAGYCIVLFRRSSEAVLSQVQQLIKYYDETLKGFSVPNEAITKRFLFQSRIIMSVPFAAVLVNTFATCTALFWPGKDPIRLAASPLYPFPVNIATKVLYSIIHFYCSAAWVLPVILYCLLCNCLGLIFNQFHIGIEKMDSNLTCKKHIKEIRRQYVHMRELCSKTDDALGFLAICVYLFDMILCCFNLYHLIYVATDVLEKVMTGFWAIMAIGNLFVMSFNASILVDKVCLLYVAVLISNHSVACLPFNLKIFVIAYSYPLDS